MRLVPEQQHKEHVKAIGAEPLPGEFHVDDTEYIELHELWRRSLPKASTAEINARIMGHLAWKMQHEKQRAIAAQQRPTHSHHLELRLIIALLALLAFLLLVPKAHCQYSHINFIQTLNAGSQIGFHAAPFRIACATNMSCTDDGFTLMLTSSSTGSTAWSAITSGTNTNGGTFAVSGNTWDFSAATALKAVIAANLAPTTSGQFGYDSTNNKWVFGQNGATVSFSNTGSCGANQYETADNATAAPTCAQVAYSQVSGTPTLYYQTIQSGGTSQTQRPTFNFIQGSNVTLTVADNAGSNRTDITIAASGGGGGTPCTTTANSLQYDNAGAFGCVADFTYSGHTVTSSSSGIYDFSASPSIKAPVAASFTTSANGNFGYDTTNTVWHLWQNGHDYFNIASTNRGSSGQVAISTRMAR